MNSGVCTRRIDHIPESLFQNFGLCVIGDNRGRNGQGTCRTAVIGAAGKHADLVGLLLLAGNLENLAGQLSGVHSGVNPLVHPHPGIAVGWLC